MTEADWLAAAEPGPMLEHLRTGSKASERKLRLFAVACCRRVWGWMQDARSREAVAVSERHADGRAGRKTLAAARRAAFSATRTTAPPAAGGHYFRSSELAAVAALQTCTDRMPELALDVENVASNAASIVSRAVGEEAAAGERCCQAALLRCIFGSPFRPAPPLAPAVLSWNAGTVPKLAAAIYEERAFGRLPVLADALEDAGCTDAAILEHCRSGGEHVRGCWVVELVLGKG